MSVFDTSRSRCIRKEISKREWTCSKKGQVGGTSSLNVIKAAGQREMERKFKVVFIMMLVLIVKHVNV